jgi:hypothetical protein
MNRVKASCHCGAIQIEVPEPAELASCNCSYCDRIGVLWAYCEPEELTLLTARDRMSTYQFGSHRNEHHHCDNCGCAVWEHIRMRDPERLRIGWNVRMAYDFDRSGLPVRMLDGRG